jgi:hypothetical protein
MQNIGIMVPEDNFDTLLRRILQQPATLPSNSASLEQLQEFSRQRNDERHEVLDILKESKGGGLGAKFHQTEEYHDTVGCTTSDLADLLANDKYDVPCVLRPAYAKFFFTSPHLPAKPLTPSYPHHSLGCGPNINIRKIDFLNKQAQEPEKHPSNPLLGAFKG